MHDHVVGLVKPETRLDLDGPFVVELLEGLDHLMLAFVQRNRQMIEIIERGKMRAMRLLPVVVVAWVLIGGRMSTLDGRFMSLLGSTPPDRVRLGLVAWCA